LGRPWRKTSLACCCHQRWKETRRFPDRQVSTKGTEKAQVEALSLACALYWLVYRHNNQISVVIEHGASAIHARMRAALAELDQGEFTEGHELDRKTEKQVPKAMTRASVSRVD